MTTDALLHLAREALYLALALSAPVVLAAALTGLLVGALQAATQIHDASVGFAPRFVVTLLAVSMCGPWIGAELVRFTGAILDAVPLVT